MVLLGWANKIICGDALEIIKKAASNIIDMIMTSPPYWGLRNYGKETCKIWDGEPECKHKWIAGSVYYSKPRDGIGSKTMGIPYVTKDALNKLKPESVFCNKCGAWYGQLGLEPLPDMYIKHLLQIFRELKRILKLTGSFYLNLGDTYAGSRCGSHEYRIGKCKNFTGREQYENKYGKPAPQASAQIPRKSLCMIPERVALAMVCEGWILRNKIIWHKPNPKPSPVKDRLNNTWEYIFHFVKKQKYYYNLDAIRAPHKTLALEMKRHGFDKPVSYKSKYPEDVGGTHRFSKVPRKERFSPRGKNPGDVFKITTKAFRGAHFAVYPEELCEAPVKAACPESVCKKCGQPKRQVLEIKPNLFGMRVRDIKVERINYGKHKTSESEVKKHQSKPKNVVIAKGCKCNSGFKPGIVLDPFCGAGTTCLVAKKLGRKFIGIDISRTYCRMARKRLAKMVH